MGAEVDLEQRLDAAVLELAAEPLQLRPHLVAERKIADRGIVDGGKDAKARAAEDLAGFDRTADRILLVRPDVGREPRHPESMRGTQRRDQRRVLIDGRGSPMVLAVHPPLDAVIAMARQPRADLLGRKLRQHAAEHAVLHRPALPAPVS